MKKIKSLLGRTEKKSCDANSVLHNRTSVFAGYANLFKALAKTAGLNVQIITGYVKHFRYNIGEKIKRISHAWNAIKIHGVWFLCDPTWGVGYVENDFKFTQSHIKSMILMDPEYAICSHFPEDERWQLLDQPISKKEFQKLPWISENFHKNQ